MKFLFINSVCGFGSTGSGVLRRYERLKKMGHDVRIVYGVNTGDTNRNTDCFFIGNRISTFFAAFCSAVLGLPGCASFIPTIKAKRFIKGYSPDVVWLSNIHGDYINEYLLLKFLKKQKIWTVYGMPDEYAFLGKCCNVTDCDKYKHSRGCYSCKHKRDYPRSYIFDNAWLKFRLKEKAYKGFTNIVFRSAPYVVGKAKESWLLRDKMFAETDSSVDVAGIFYPRDPSCLREKYGIEAGVKVVLTCAPFSNPLKGVEYFRGAATISEQRKNKIIFINVGYDGDEAECPSNFLPIKYTNDKNVLAEFYSLADVYVCTSLADAQPNTCLEALGCGTPIIGFNISGVPYIAPNEFGKYVSEISQDALLDAIEKQPFKDQEMIMRCHNYAMQRYSTEASQKVFEDFIAMVCDRVSTKK